VPCLVVCAAGGDRGRRQLDRLSAADGYDESGGRAAHVYLRREYLLMSTAHVYTCEHSGSIDRSCVRSLTPAMLVL
jgi:hypothetical protein